MRYYRIIYSTIGSNAKTAIIPAMNREDAKNRVLSNIDSAMIKSISLTNRMNAMAHFTTSKLDILQVSAIIDAIPESAEDPDEQLFAYSYFDGNKMVDAVKSVINPDHE